MLTGGCPWGGRYRHRAVLAGLEVGGNAIRGRALDTRQLAGRGLVEPDLLELRLPLLDALSDILRHLGWISIGNGDRIKNNSWNSIVPENASLADLRGPSVSNKPAQDR